MFDNQTHKKFRVQFCSIPEHNQLNDCIQLSPVVFNCKFVPFCLIRFTGICANAVLLLFIKRVMTSHTFLESRTGVDFET